MKLLLAVALVLAMFSPSPDWQALGKQWWAHVQFLADDRREGRGTGSAGFEQAANYMAQQFEAAGLAPAGSDGFRQPMDFDVTQIDQPQCSLALLRDSKVEPLKLGEDAVIGVNSHSAEHVEAAVVFVG